MSRYYEIEANGNNPFFFFSLEVLSIPGRTVVFIVVFVDEVS